MEVPTIGTFLGNGFQIQSLVGSMAELPPNAQGSSSYRDFRNPDRWEKRDLVFIAGG